MRRDYRERGGKGLRNGCLKDTYIWEVQFAERRSKMRRAMERMLMGKREKIERKRENREEKEDVLAGKMCLGGKWWWLVGVYIYYEYMLTTT